MRWIGCSPSRSPINLPHSCVRLQAIAEPFYNPHAGTSLVLLWRHPGGALEAVRGDFHNSLILANLRLNFWLSDAFPTPCLDGEGTVKARRVPHVVHVTNCE